MENLQFGYEPNKNYGNHHAQVRNKISSSFKKSYDDLNTTIQILMNDLKKLQSGKMGYLKDRQAKQDIIILCKQINKCFADMKVDFESNNLTERKYLLSLNTLKVMIDTLPDLNKYGLFESGILGECLKRGVIK